MIPVFGTTWENPKGDEAVLGISSPVASFFFSFASLSFPTNRICLLPLLLGFNAIEPIYSFNSAQTLGNLRCIAGLV
jgi:hypothetical protein